MRYRHLVISLVLVLVGVASATAAPRIDPELPARLAAASPTSRFCVILTFHGNQITDSMVGQVQSLGVSVGVRMVNFPILAVNATPDQINRMTSWNSLRSIYLNTPLQFNLHQTKPLIGVTRLTTDAALTARNGGQPVSGRGVTIAINDSGIDGSHSDLAFNPLNSETSKTIQNVLVNPNGQDGLILRADALGNPVEGILPPAYVENVINTDTHVGHGTHCAGIAAGTGQSSGGLYQGVAPGAKLLGLGSGGILFVLGQVAAFDYIYTNQFLYNIRVVNNSWGNSAVAADPDHPINVASRKLHDEAHIVVVYANGNDGPRPNSQNRWASLPWTINVGASTKDGRLASFSSRGIFGDPTIHPTVLTPGTGGPAEQGFSSAVIAARSRTNLVASGLNADAEIPPAFVANYTQISGTSMAAPHLAGIVACMLEANPQLLPGDVKAILEKTATPLATYDQFEVGAGLANVHAAVDLAFNPEKEYGKFGFALSTRKGLSLDEQPSVELEGSVPSGGNSAHSFTVPPGTRFTFVQLDWDGSVGEDALLIDNTKIVINDLALSVMSGAQTIASSNAVNLAALFGAREAVKMEFPQAGNYTARISAGLAGLGVITTQPYRLKVTHYTFDQIDEVRDVFQLDAATKTKAHRLVYDQIMQTRMGLFRPQDSLTRAELARALMLGARVPQFLPNESSFIDLTAGTPEALFAESLKREGVMGVDTGSVFGPLTEVDRLEQAVALVRALRLDAQARALAGTTIRVNNQPIIENNQIPPALRGYVQIAIDRGLMEAFPATIRQIGPGQFEAVPGPRFEPGRIVKRVEFINPATRLLSLMFGE